MLRRSLILSVTFLLLSSTVAFADPFRVVVKGLTILPSESTSEVKFEGRERSAVPPSLDAAFVATVEETSNGHAFSGNASFSAPPLTVSAPALPVPDVPIVGLTVTPVAELALVAPALAAPDPGVLPIFASPAIGQGLASIGFFNQPALAAELGQDSVNAAATPEPGSLLLFATGAAWIGSRWRKRRAMSAQV